MSYFEGDCKYDPCEECPIVKLTPEQQDICARGLSILERKHDSDATNIDRMMASQGFSAVVRNAVGGKTYAQEGQAVMQAMELRILGKCRIEEDEL